MTTVLHPALRRLDDLAAGVSSDPAVLGVLGFGSSGAEHSRFDEYSDIDFILVVADPAAKDRYLAGVDWLSGFGGSLAYSFAHEPNGRKAFFADGLFLEYAVLTPHELAALPVTGGRVVCSRPGLDLSAGPAVGRPRSSAIDTVEFHRDEAMTNLLVGLRRELRGEHLTAMRFIQVYAVDRVLALVRLAPGTVWPHPDPFEATRRVEAAVTPLDLPLDQMIPGYRRNRDAAREILSWLTTNHRPDAVLVAAVEALLDRPPASART